MSVSIAGVMCSVCVCAGCAVWGALLSLCPAGPGAAQTAVKVSSQGSLTRRPTELCEFCNNNYKMLQHWASEGEFYTGCFYCATSLSRLRLRVARWSHCIELQWAGYFYVLHVEVIVLNFNEPVTFTCCTLKSLYWTSMSRLRLRVACWSHCIELQWAGYFYVLHVEVIVLNFIEPVTFTCCTLKSL